MIELRHLKYFVAVAKELSIGRAAVALNISQPPLTRQIQQLEEDLGAVLFVRSVKGVELTDAGRTLYEEARNILSLVDLASERTRRAAQGRIGRLDVGIFGSGMYDIIPRVLRKFRAAFPEVKIVLHPMTKDAQVEALRQRRINVGFNRLVPRYPDIASRVVMWERLYIVVPESDPLAGRAEVSIAELVDSPFVLFPKVARPNFNDFVASLCQRHGFVPHIAQEVGEATTGVALVASGFGVCIVPESVKYFRADGVVYLPMTESPPTMLDVTCLYCLEDNSPILAEFLGVLEEFRRENDVVGDPHVL
ncbi:DNA-binding transcriptional LysR family regulator [Roseiarcus fermentans]|uniref:DNA-binding transcriptional LysR family regulator n=1 Tax=Roseiarcus fermentans TaxID=1473586 RepID=A0A366FHA3_9HYPH|nr:LysR family transcriptional regulator [Roseiarcus fermentans]RBP13981.1 DNA-binding transcriptional LysR family regulator [Roseiarcus fermentans]